MRHDIGWLRCHQSRQTPRDGIRVADVIGVYGRVAASLECLVKPSAAVGSGVGEARKERPFVWPRVEPVSVLVLELEDIMVSPAKLDRVWVLRLEQWPVDGVDEHHDHAAAQMAFGTLLAFDLWHVEDAAAAEEVGICASRYRHFVVSLVGIPSPNVHRK